MSEKKVVLMDFDSNANIGLYVFVNDKFAIIGKEVDKNKKNEIESVLGVPIYKSTVLGTDLIGVFVAGNNDILCVPDMYDYELKEFEKIAKDHDIKLLILDDKQNTLGNNLCFANDKILVNKEYSSDFKANLKEKTKYKILPIGTTEYKCAGSICSFTNGKFFISQELTEKDVENFIDEIGGNGTVNSGNNFISSGVVGNCNGLILGSACSTVEIQNIVESLDYL